MFIFRLKVRTPEFEAEKTFFPFWIWLFITFSTRHPRSGQSLSPYIVFSPCHGSQDKPTPSYPQSTSSKLLLPSSNPDLHHGKQA